MAKVIGLGGVFVKSRNLEALRTWYRDMLGLDVSKWGGAVFEAPPGSVSTWSSFADDSKHFDPSPHRFMVNFRVDDLDALLAQLRAAGATVLDRGSNDEYGKFGYVVDPDDTLVELWEPAPNQA